MGTEIRVSPDIILSEIKLHHAETIFEVIEKQREVLSEWLPWVASSKNVQDTRNFILAVYENQAPKRDRVFEVWQNKEFCGLVGLKEIDLANLKTEIGYWLSPDYWGKGIMTRSCAKLLEYSFQKLSLNKVQIKCGVGNIRSKNIPLQLGFKLEGIEQAGELLHGQFIDLEVYGLVKKDWIQYNKETK